MKVENLEIEINIEVLVPGILQTIILLKLFPGLVSFIPEFVSLNNNAFGAQLLTLTIFLATAYAAGVFCTIFARLIMDSPADWSFTPLLLRVFEKEDFPKAWNPFTREGRKGRDAILKQYKKVRRQGERSEKPGLSNIVKYRRLTQTLRACVVPAGFFTWSLVDCSTLVVQFVSVALTYLFGLFLFSYGEVAIYEQTRKIESDI